MLFVVERGLLFVVEFWEVVGSAMDGAAAVGNGDGHEVADVDLSGLAELECEWDPVLDFLWAAGLDDGHADVLGEVSGVGGDLCGVAPWVVAADDESAAGGVAPGVGWGADACEYAECERVACDVQADGFECGDGAAAGHLCAVDHGDGECFVVGDFGDDAFFVEDGADGLEGVEEA